MSVVNDVLKNLNQRKSLGGQVGSTPYYFQDQPRAGKWLWVGLIMLLALCCVLTTVLVIGYNDIKQESKSDIYLPEDVFFVDTSSDGGINNSDQSDNSLKVSNLSNKKEEVELNASDSNLAISQIIKEEIESKEGSNNSVEIVPQKNNYVTAKKENRLVQKTAESKASESVITAVNTGDLDKAKVNLSKASKRIQSEVQFRLLLKENPEALMPQIRNLHPNFIENPSLLALAAQGQQRSGAHESAIELYTKLIPLEPNDARWRSGLAISLEKLGDSQSAKRLYKLALSMGGLPYSLKRFSENRLERLNH